MYIHICGYLKKVFLNFTHVNTNTKIRGLYIVSSWHETSTGVCTEIPDPERSVNINIVIATDWQSNVVAMWRKLITTTSDLPPLHFKPLSNLHFVTSLIDTSRHDYFVFKFDQDGAQNDRYNCHFVSSSYRWKPISCFLMISHRGHVLTKNSRGPRTKPWETPDNRCFSKESCPCKITCSWLVSKS